ncbi:Z1 domain-containing protein [uncultured Algibacter sp.]|uniref:Z1 domain-containing protein n=1 Tax=uncultured Algibacter sp. TaxID=298659 RepID=UPI0030EEC63E|tara:strand:+ start:1502 stop:4309 length:2808 start_codon:yes stop_codon:yes gene_type:complete
MEDIITRILLTLDSIKENRAEEINDTQIEDIVTREVDFFNSISIKNFKVSDVLEEVKSKVRIRPSEITELVADNHQSWWYNVKSENNQYWYRYKELLKRKHFPYIELDSFTDRILDKCENPKKKGSWDRRGLVVGNVQSGKTANYIGLINKAVDSGYKLIIVIAGIHNNLRSQTQRRIETDFIGKTTGENQRFVGVGKINRELAAPFTLTTGEKDFNKSIANQTMADIRNSGSTILVIKKNKSVLESLIHWLSNQDHSEGDDFNVIKDLPMLLIDDEADNASVNSGKKEDDPKTINKLIRILLSQFDQKTFIGYTATPYANIFIPDAINSENEYMVKSKRYTLGDDLFPRDFIINIKAPSNYFGASRIFGSSSWDGDNDDEVQELNVIRFIDDQSEDSVFPTKINKDNKDNLPDYLPLSLEESLKSYVIASSIRLLRGDDKKHCSMLIHVALYVAWIDKIAHLVDKQITAYRYLVEGNDYEFIGELKLFYEKDFLPTTELAVDIFKEGEEPKIKVHDWEEIKPFLLQALNRIKVFSVHGTKNLRNRFHEYTHELDYTDPNGVFAIAVGGNRLSRGITLEGLTVSYYLRASKLYDTLMQMGRWFGYRPGYVDLCRVYTTRDLVGHYRHITVATEEMRRDFDDMAARNKTPGDYQLKVMSHPSVLSITSMGKMRETESFRIGFSGDVKQTYEISKNGIDIRNNFTNLSNFINELKEQPKYENRLYSWQGDYGNEVKDFIRNYNTKQSTVNPRILSSYIDQLTKTKKITEWSIAIDNNISSTVLIGENKTRHTTYSIDTLGNNSINLNCVVRNETSISSDNKDTLIISKHQILNPRHPYLDLNITEEDFKNNKEAGKRKSYLIHNEREKSKRGLLVIYPLDPRGVNHIDTEFPLIGYFIAFPRIKDDEKVEYSVRKDSLESSMDFDYDYEQIDDDTNE